MSIMEEQNMNGEHNTDVTGNMDAPTRAPSAKKVYSKPTLVVLSQNEGTQGKIFPRQNEATARSPIASGPTS